jgi:hypothetical protein
MKHNVDIFDGKSNKCGTMRFTTELIMVDYIPPTPSDDLDKKTMMILKIKEA